LALQARFLAYNAMLHRRLGRASETRIISERVLEIAQKQGFDDYIGVALALLCWVALREGGDVEVRATEALAAWGRLPAGYTYPLQWLARIPLAAQLTSSGRLDDAVAQWQLLLDPAQCLLPDRLDGAIRAVASRRVADGVTDPNGVLRLVELARELRLL
jgi:hypothetical protein